MSVSAANDGGLFLSPHCRRSGQVLSTCRATSPYASVILDPAGAVIPDLLLESTVPQKGDKRVASKVPGWEPSSSSCECRDSELLLEIGLFSILALEVPVTLSTVVSKHYGDYPDLLERTSPSVRSFLVCFDVIPY